MSRADLEREAEEKWREYKASGAVKHHGRAKSHFIAAYIQGRLDQAEADARIAGRMRLGPDFGRNPITGEDSPYANEIQSHDEALYGVITEIRKGVE